MINKSDSRCAVVRFCYHSYDYRPNWTPLSPITITKRIILEGNATNAQFCATIFVTVAIQPGFENNPKKMIMTRKIPACRILISNSNWTEWSTIQGVIGRVISNRPSAKREADLKLRIRLLAELYDTRSNY